MKILMQNSIFFPNVIGGAEIATHVLGMELRKRGLEVDAVATTGKRGGLKELSTRPTEDGLGTVFEAPSHGLCDFFDQGSPPPQPGFLMRGLHHFLSVKSGRWHGIFLDVLRRSQPDVVHTNNIVGMTPAIWSAAQESRVPVVHTLHDYHLLCPRTTLLRSNNSNCVDPPLPCGVLAGLKLRQTHAIEAVTAPSQFVLDRHLKTGGFSGAWTKVVPNACEYLPPQIPERKLTGPVSGLFLGQIDEHKGLLLLLQTLQKLFSDPRFDELEFHFAGKGPCEDQVLAFCNQYPDRSHFHGVVKGQNKFDLLSKASFQVVPSLWNDNFPLSILDGFSWGIPVIGTQRGGIPEVIRDGLDGFVVNPGTEHLASAIASYVESPELRQLHGRSARLRAEEFTFKRQVDRFQAIYSKLLNNRGDGVENPA